MGLSSSSVYIIYNIFLNLFGALCVQRQKLYRGCFLRKNSQEANRGSSSLYVPSPLKIPDDLIFLHQFIVKSLKNRAADVELENNFTNGMGHDIQRLPIRFNEVIIVLCAELNLTSNYGCIKDKIFLFKMRFFFLLHLDF